MASDDEITPVKAIRKPGGAKNDILYIAPDFDAAMEDFKEYQSCLPMRYLTLTE
ncbi:MAG: hypothetical protein HQL64_00915 [Magnetococcales bacterium]|nr:hypothetical protein [Magnetococcales bacterium]